MAPPLVNAHHSANAELPAKKRGLSGPSQRTVTTLPRYIFSKAFRMAAGELEPAAIMLRLAYTLAVFASLYDKLRRIEAAQRHCTLIACVYED